MSLHDELAEPRPVMCKICTYLDTLSDEDRAEWEKELALPVASIGNMAVVYTLQRRGVFVEETSVRRHRRNHGLSPNSDESVAKERERKRIERARSPRQYRAVTKNPARDNALEAALAAKLLETLDRIKALEEEHASA
jgi:hypothetical protein